MVFSSPSLLDFATAFSLIHSAPGTFLPLFEVRSKLTLAVLSSRYPVDSRPNSLARSWCSLYDRAASEAV